MNEPTNSIHVLDRYFHFQLSENLCLFYDITLNEYLMETQMIFYL